MKIQKAMFTHSLVTQLLERVKTVGDTSGFRKYPEGLNEMADGSGAASVKNTESLINSKLRMSP